MIRLYLLVHNNAQPSLPLHNRIRHAHLPTQRRQKDDQFNGIHIIRNQHQIRLLILNQAHHMVQPILNRIRLLTHILLLLPLIHRRRLLQQPLLLLRLRLRLVFVEQLEGLRGGVAVQHVGELRDGRGDFETQVEDFLLALQADVFGPFYHAREVAAGLDVLAYAEVAGALFDEGVLLVWRCSLISIHSYCLEDKRERNW